MHTHTHSETRRQIPTLQRTKKLEQTFRHLGRCTDDKMEEVVVSLGWRASGKKEVSLDRTPLGVALFCFLLGLVGVCLGMRCYAGPLPS